MSTSPATAPARFIGLPGYEDSSVGRPKLVKTSDMTKAMTAAIRGPSSVSMSQRL